MIASRRKPWKEFDFLGSFLLTVASALTVFALQNASTDPNQWGRAAFLAPFLVALGSWAAFGGWEWQVERNYAKGKSAVTPTWPASLLQNRLIAASLLYSVFTSITFFIVIFPLPLRFQIVNRESSLMAGVLLLPMLGAVAIGSTLSGSVMNKTKNLLFETLLSGACFLLLGCGLLTTLSSEQPLEAKSLGFAVFVGLGNGLSVSGVTILAILAPTLADQGWSCHIGCRWGARG